MSVEARKAAFSQKHDWHKMSTKLSLQFKKGELKTSEKVQKESYIAEKAGELHSFRDGAKSVCLDDSGWELRKITDSGAKLYYKQADQVHETWGYKVRKEVPVSPKKMFDIAWKMITVEEIKKQAYPEVRSLRIVEELDNDAVITQLVVGFQHPSYSDAKVDLVTLGSRKVDTDYRGIVASISVERDDVPVAKDIIARMVVYSAAMLIEPVESNGNCCIITSMGQGEPAKEQFGVSAAEYQKLIDAANESELKQIEAMVKLASQ